MRILSFLREKSSLSGVSHGFLANIVIALATLATGIVSARYLGPEGRGYLAALITLPTFLPYLLTFGLPTGLLYQLRNQPEQSGPLMGAGLLGGVLCGLLAVAIAIVAVPVVLREMPAQLEGAARIAAAFTFFNVLILYLMSALQAKDEFLAYNAIRYAHPLIVFCATLIAALAGGLTPFSGALIVLAAGLPGTAFGLAWTWRHYRPRLAHLRTSFHLLRSYSLRAYTGDLTLAFATQIDKVLVVGMLAPDLMGIYTVALNLSRLVGLFSNSVVPVLFPRTVGRAQQEVLEVTSRAARVTILFAGAATCVLMLAGPLLMHLIYGAAFGRADFALRLLVAEAAVASVIQVLSQAFMALDRPGLVTLQFGSGALATVPLLLILTPRYGVDGVAVTLLLATLVRLGFTYWSFAVAMRAAPPKLWGGFDSSMALLLAAVRERSR